MSQFWALNNNAVPTFDQFPCISPVFLDGSCNKQPVLVNTYCLLILSCNISQSHSLRSMAKWNESGFRPPLCTYRLNWARRTSWGWWDDWDDTVLQTQDSKFEPWRSEAEHATSRSRRLPAVWLHHETHIGVTSQHHTQCSVVSLWDVGLHRYQPILCSGFHFETYICISPYHTLAVV